MAGADPLFANLLLLEPPEHGHLTGSIRYAMGAVRTRFVLVLQQDLPLIRPVDFLQALRTMEANTRVKHLRFNTHPQTPPAFNCIMGTVIPAPAFVPLIRTEGWSDQNHLTTVAYYQDLVLPYAETGPGRDGVPCHYGKDV